MPAGPCTTSRTVALPAISSASPSPSPSPSSFGATVLFMLAQTSTTSEWVRASVTARLAATTLSAGPGVAPATNTMWLPSPSAAATPWPRSVNDRQVEHALGVRGAVVPLVAPVHEEGNDQADEQPQHKPAGDDQRLLGAARL